MNKKNMIRQAIKYTRHRRKKKLLALNKRLRDEIKIVTFVSVLCFTQRLWFYCLYFHSSVSSKSDLPTMTRHQGDQF